MKIQLPYNFRYTGPVLLGIVLIGLLILKQLEHPLLEDFYAFSKYTLSIVALGFLLSIFSKEKVEDERVNRLRGRAFAYSFIVGALFVVWAELLPGEGFEWIQNSGGLIIFLQMSYLGQFWSLKRKDR